MIDYPIDIVIPWVDGDDPAWRAERARYTADSNSDNSEARYREWDLFRYWFRGIETYAPWVRTIHLVTWGHLPPWLNTEHPKLHIVNHRDFIPREYLPTFSSHAIELNMHRIPGLSEHFLYFNDDVYMTRISSPDDFFSGDLPRDTAVFGIVKNTDIENFMPYIMLNMLALINMNFSKRKMLRRDFAKWFSPKNGKGVLNNLYLLPWGSFTGFRNYHTCIAYRKQTLSEVWEKFPDILDQTCNRRFRSREDVNQYLFRYWQLVNGQFQPRKPDSAYITIGTEPPEAIAAAMDSKKNRIVCVNDDPMGFDFEQERPRVAAVFESRFPALSSFETDA